MVKPCVCVLQKRKPIFLRGCTVHLLRKHLKAEIIFSLFKHLNREEAYFFKELHNYYVSILRGRLFYN